MAEQGRILKIWFIYSQEASSLLQRYSLDAQHKDLALSPNTVPANQPIAPGMVLRAL